MVIEKLSHWVRLEVSFGCLRGDGGHLPNLRPRGWRLSALHHAAALEGGKVPQSTLVKREDLTVFHLVESNEMMSQFFFAHLSPRSWACLRIAWRHRVIWSWCTGPSFFKLFYRSWWWTTAWYHPQLGSQTGLSHAVWTEACGIFYVGRVGQQSGHLSKCFHFLDLRCTDTITRKTQEFPTGLRPTWSRSTGVLCNTCSLARNPDSHLSEHPCKCNQNHLLDGHKDKLNDLK